MKISLITVSSNSAATIADTIASVRKQNHKEIEYIIVDGASTDNTLTVIKQNEDVITRWISEPDKGIYDAMNKAIRMTSGEVVGIINSDDYYHADNIIAQVVNAFKNENVDAVFGDLVFVDPSNLDKVVRTYSSKSWYPEKFARGFMPAHPTFFVRKKYYDQLGLFKTDYKIAADYELLIRFLYVNKLRYKYLPLTMVTMRRGGASTGGFKSNIVLNNEIVRACRENGIATSLWKVYPKYFIKIFELFTIR